MQVGLPAGPFHQHVREGAVWLWDRAEQAAFVDFRSFLFFDSVNMTPLGYSTV